MFKKLYPDLYVNSLKEIPLDEIKAMKKEGFILDLDNTITEWNSNDITQEVIDWFHLIESRGFKACILSNNGERRIMEVAEQLEIPYIYRAQKPRRGGFYRAAESLGISIDNTVVVGDQIFTDVLGGNRAGFFTILVVPINKKEFLGTKISRAMEFFVLKRLKREM
ncbi:MAG TPA: YqeG family HAD IIIA-type phosphatase [Syntrophomonadaceae bacterium]|nr:YqeG family HAD IIIA-type phosphatase [Syntrophomonadaceae bacterium]